MVPVAPSAIPFDKNSITPRALSTDEVKEMVEKFRKAIQRALKAGVDTIELHGAHGYLIHQFHSSLINKREDEYGKDPTKFGREVIEAAKAEMPGDMPLFMRISAKEYTTGGYGLNESIELVNIYQKAGVDMFDVSSGGEAPIDASSMNKPGHHSAYQVPFAREIKKALNVPVISVGRLDDAAMADSVVRNKDADLVAIGRGMLQNPYWALNAEVSLTRKDPWYGSISDYTNFAFDRNKIDII